jgi:hypothetical protein
MMLVSFTLFYCKFRSENASLVRLRKQQELALKEMVTQKEEVHFITFVLTI